jgi:hypothetical protein
MGYSRAAFYPWAVVRAAKLVELFAWPLTTKILIVGAGYGWLAEELETTHGYTDIVTTDTSPHVQNTQDSSEEAEVDAAITALGLDPASGEGLTRKGLFFTPGNRRRHSRSVQDEGLNNNGSRNRVRNVLGSVDVAISENLAPILDDSEVIQVAGWIDQVDTLDEVIHLVTELQMDDRVDPPVPLGGQDLLFNWKLLEDWKLLVPSHTWVSLNSWEVL